MAMGSDSVPNRSVSEKERVKSSVKKQSKLQKIGVDALPATRNGKPEIRVIGRRIYDPVNGKTCHQCRHQKTIDIVGAYTILKNNKICTVMYCHKCLLNRYGEKADEVSALEEWTCPKCRGICNCSICMKRKGHQPTGVLINTAKKAGFSSVSEMLLKGEEHLVVGSPKTDVVITSPGKRGNENSFDGELDANMLNHAKKKVKKVEEDNNIMSQSSDNKKLSQKGLEVVHEQMAKKKKRDMLDETKPEKNDEETNKQTNNVLDDEKKPKKSRKGDLINVDSKKSDVTLARRTSPRKLNVPNNNGNVITEKCSVKPSENGKREDENGFTANDMSTRKHQIADSHVEILLPTGIEMDSVAGIDVSTKDVGNVLQFLEFCAVFGKILEVEKGQPEHVLRDLLHGRIGRRGKFSLTVQFHINLLSIILSEQGEEYANLSPAHGKGSWFSALKKCLSESQSVLKAQGLDCLAKAADYETLEASEKLRLLNILCDEVLETEKVRNWMDDQNVKHAEKVKEDRQKVAAAKDQEKILKQKMKDDIAKAIITKHGANLSISEHEAIVSRFKRKTSQAHAKVLESKGILLKNNQHPETVRIEPIFMGVDGHVYWKLNCLGKSDVLHQTANGDSLTFDDKWFIIDDDEGREVVDKRISSSRRM